MIKIYLVKTDKCCFVTDIMATSGYDWQYHHSKLENLFFDGNKPEKTFSPNWLKINKYPNNIQELVSQLDINIRYEIKNPDLISDKLPSVISKEDINLYSSDIINLYQYKSDKQEPVLQDVEYEIEIVMEVENFEFPPVINYKAMRNATVYEEGREKIFNITNIDIKHQLFDKLIFPAVMLHNRPCSISSHNLYCLIRQYVKDNIDTKVAKITSDYDFCFTVKKVVPLLEPETVSYQNIFARTKKERNKINYVTKRFNEVEIFEMTHDQSRYQNYTVIQSIFADSELELQKKIDEFLENLITIINKPLCLCSECKGTGYTENIKRIKQSELL